MVALVQDREARHEGPRRSGSDRPEAHSGARVNRCASEMARVAGWRRAVVAGVAVVALMMLGGTLSDAAAGLAGGRAPAGPRASGPSSNPSSAVVAVVSGSAVVPGSAGPVHVVQPGETYWSLAEALGGDGDIRARVDALEAGNGRRPLQVGDRLVVQRKGMGGEPERR